MSWLAVYTKPRQEKQAAENLERQDFKVYLPRIRQRKRCNSAYQWTVGPLFPRYLFIEVVIGEQNIAPVRSTPAVVDLVRCGQRMMPVDERIIECLMQKEDSAIQARWCEDKGYVPGDRVEILDGALTGLTGIFQISSGAQRAEVLVALLGRQTRVLVQQDSIGAIASG
ncbi:MAG: transcriptional antiterminator RfaH [Halieaceae bacterium]